MGKTAVFVLACLQQIDSSEKAGGLKLQWARIDMPCLHHDRSAVDIQWIAEAVRTLVVCHTRELAYQVGELNWKQ